MSSPYFSSWVCRAVEKTFQKLALQKQGQWKTREEGKKEFLCASFRDVFSTAQQSTNLREKVHLGTAHCLVQKSLLDKKKVKLKFIILNSAQIVYCSTNQLLRSLQTEHYKNYFHFVIWFVLFNLKITFGAENAAVSGKFSASVKQASHLRSNSKI